VVEISGQLGNYADEMEERYPYPLICASGGLTNFNEAANGDSNILPEERRRVLNPDCMMGLYDGANEPRVIIEVEISNRSSLK
jgi:hypothetical protein